MSANSVVKSVFKKSGTSISASVSGDKLVHEAGGIEADISAVAKGDILAGSGTGAIGIIAASGKSDGDVLTLQADGTVDYEAAAGGGGSFDGIDDQTSSNDDQLTITDTEVVINEDHDDLDFRVESDTVTHALFVQGSDGYVGIGTASPTVPLTSTNTNATGVAFSLPHFTVQQKNYDWSGEPAGDGEWSDSDYKSIQAWNEYNGGFFTLYTKSGGGGTRSYGRSVQPFVMSGGGDNALSYTAWNATGFTQAKSGASPDPNWRLSGGYLQGRPAEHDWGSASGEATWYITCWGKCGTFQ